MARRDFPEVPGYLTPTIGSTAVASGATVSTIAGLTLTNPTINNSALGYTTVATAGGTTTLTNASNYHHIFTGLSSQIVVMPVASTVVVGTKYIIENNSIGGNITVRSSGANTIATVLQGTSVEFTCILSSGTTAASWNAEFVGYSTNTGTGANVLATDATVSGININGTLLAGGTAGTSGQVLTTTGAGGYVHWTTPSGLPSASNILTNTPLVADGYGSVVWSNERGTYTLTSASATRVDETPNATAVKYLLHAISGSRYRFSEVSLLWDFMGNPSVTETNVITKGSAITGFTVSADQGFMATGPGLVITTSFASENTPVAIRWQKTPLGEFY